MNTVKPSDFKYLDIRSLNDKDLNCYEYTLMAREIFKVLEKENAFKLVSIDELMEHNSKLKKYKNDSYLHYERLSKLMSNGLDFCSLIDDSNIYFSFEAIFEKYKIIENSKNNPNYNDCLKVIDDYAKTKENELEIKNKCSILMVKNAKTERIINWWDSLPPISKYCLEMHYFSSLNLKIKQIIFIYNHEFPI